MSEYVFLFRANQADHHRAIAIGQRDGAGRGLEALAAIADRDRLARYPFYPAAQGELEFQRGDRVAARKHFQDALVLARNEAERRFLEKRLRSCDSSNTGANP